MANIQKRGEKSWYFTVSLGRGADGRYIRKTKTITIDDEALLKTKKKLQDYLEAEYVKFKQEVEAGEYIAPQKMTFASFVDEWKIKYAQRELGAKTLENYMIQVNNRLVPEFGHMTLDQIKPMHILTFLEKLQHEGGRKDGKEGALSSGMIQYVHRVMKNIFNRAVEWRFIKTNPMQDIKKPKVEQAEISVYDEKEVEHLFEALEHEKLMWRVMISLALTTGLRRGELLALEWKNIDLDNRVIDVRQSLTFVKESGYLIKEPKTKNSLRKVSIPQSLVPDLKALKIQCNKDRLNAAELWEGGDHFFVFSAWHGKPLYPSSVKTWWSRFIKKNNLRYIRFHDLRHTSATLLINQGVHAKIISERLGHANILTTMNIYGHALRSADQAAADKFDTLLSKRNKA